MFQSCCNVGVPVVLAQAVVAGPPPVRLLDSPQIPRHRIIIGSPDTIGQGPKAQAGCGTHQSLARRRKADGGRGSAPATRSLSRRQNRVEGGGSERVVDRAVDSAGVDVGDQAERGPVRVV